MAKIKHQKKLLITVSSDYESDVGIEIMENIIRNYVMSAITPMDSYKKDWHMEVEEVDE